MPPEFPVALAAAELACRKYRWITLSDIKAELDGPVPTNALTAAVREAVERGWAYRRPRGLFASARYAGVGE